MRKIFALEEADLELEGVEVTVGDTEELEAVEVETEIEEEATDLESDANMIDEAEASLDQGEEIVEVVESSLEKEEGLEPIAAEAIRIAMEAVCARVGANPKSIYSLYATENFESPSSRKANTRIALEGMKDFLKDLWEKIKKAVKSMKEKFKAFWDKHISSLGRMKKTLEAMKKKVNAAKGTLKNSMIDKAPGKIGGKFPVAGEYISVDSIMEYVAGHLDLVKNDADESKVAIDALETLTAKTADTGIETFYNNLKVKEGEDPLENLVGGKKIVVKTELNKEEHTLSVEIKTENMEGLKKDVPLHLAEKSDLTSLIAKTITMIDATVSAKANLDKVDRAALSSEKELNNAIAAHSKEGGKAESIKALRSMVKVYNKIIGKQVKMGYTLISLNVKCAAGVVSYTKLSLSNYKE